MNSGVEYFLAKKPRHLNKKLISGIIRCALREDLGKGDVTTKSIIPARRNAKAVFLAKESCVICGLEVVKMVFKMLDAGIKFNPFYKDGDIAGKGKVIAQVAGNARSILTAERAALNLLSFMSGIATKTREYTRRVKPYKVKIADTRKTIPGLRILQKYAVRTGGGYNHRMRLDEMILIKDNHLKIQNSKFKIQKLLKKIAKKKPVEIEVKNLNEFKKMMQLKPNIIMLDNMNISQIKKAVRFRSNLFPEVKIEVSGGVNLKTVRKIASCGVDVISVGELTHSLNSADISLEAV